MPKKTTAVSNVVSVDAIIESLADKKLAVREKALLELCDASRKYIINETVVNKKSLDLMTALLACLKKGAKAEALQTCTTLQAVIVACNDTLNESFDENVYSLGLQLRSHPSDAVRGKVATVISLGALLCGLHEESVSKIMERLSGYFRDSSSEVVAACLRGWTLLASSLPDAVLSVRRGLYLEELAAP
eukprot:CAMPEP_0113675766 /NCGR_PEP_ID=MMETSP0038_2-20120614/8219_1 /TAXON_ID=2898 /ORGANISM="Cryptomonas paramecium" /LENGTH=188 /DNA_ID=CAMNT_0000592619 /DNA_START=111 /DNA_END=674 /DNA_ORIENTATION=- /assembly_acc=CAM_ASM_000170